MHVEATPLIEWPEPLLELLNFVGNFLATGAIGFRYVVARRAPGAVADALDDSFYERATRRAGALGLLGATMVATHLALKLPGQAERAHVTVGALISTHLDVGVWIGFAVLSMLGFSLVSRGWSGAWLIAAIGAIGIQLRSALFGKWLGLINPVHKLAAGFWIGTLFVLVVCGIALALRDDVPRERRGPLVADMVNRFSPLALVSAATLVTFGVTTAWRHLKPLSSLWTTPYGYALIVKLCLVAVVFALGAWNWRRQRPALGSEATAAGLRRSARAELISAALVLIVTAVVVSLPSPRPPGSPPPGAAPSVTPPGAPAAAPHN